MIVPFGTIVNNNTDNIHAHYIVNSGQYYTGNKLQQNYQTTRKLKLDIKIPNYSIRAAHPLADNS